MKGLEILICVNGVPTPDLWTFQLEAHIVTEHGKAGVAVTVALGADDPDDDAAAAHALAEFLKR